MEIKQTQEISTQRRMELFQKCNEDDQQEEGYNTNPSQF